MSYREPSWPKWAAVVAQWNEKAVPDVSVVPYPNPRRPVFRWDRKTNYPDGNAFFGSSNPQDDTAFHLACTLPQHDPQLTIAFKLEAFARSFGFDGFAGYVRGEAHRLRSATHLGWWNSNAKHVLPLTSSWEFHERLTYEEQARRWRELVDGAATVWSEIANELYVVRVPELMAHDSPEYLAVARAWNAERDLRERREYERLRAKFERPTT